MPKQPSKAALVGAVSSVAMIIMLGGCNQQDPASVCSSPDTTQNVTEIIENEALKLADSDEQPKLKSALDMLSVSKLLPLTLITLTSNDKDTKKISCSAQIKLKVPDNAQKAAASPAGLALYMGDSETLGAAGFKDGEADITIDYSRQPSADGKTFVYAVNSVEKLAHVVAFIGKLELAAQANPADQADDRPPVHADAVDEPDSDAAASSNP